MLKIKYNRINDGIRSFKITSIIPFSTNKSRPTPPQSCTGAFFSNLQPSAKHQIGHDPLLIHYLQVKSRPVGPSHIDPRPDLSTEMEHMLHRPQHPSVHTLCSLSIAVSVNCHSSCAPTVVTMFSLRHDVQSSRLSKANPLWHLSTRSKATENVFITIFVFKRSVWLTS